ncbi:LysR family transcriptional regulator [Paraburkholderia sp. RP-4-7]|uniref:LysR family transcriptional regulator n=2 Tax=Paraburkholderia polaris TaxID=2728848 RepID=A0A848IMY9_9BURK|nr:LysR family transcriptional regulator [Paraburkholderia polaris]
MSYGPSEIKLIRVYASVVQNQGFAAAQEKLNLSVSAISTYMSQLETLVGVTLCHRGRGGFRLTEKGRLYYAEVQALLDRLDSFESYTSALRDDLGGSLNVGLIDSIVSDPALPLAAVIREFISLHPRVRLSMHVANPYELQVAVTERRMDLAIGTFPTSMNGLVFQELYNEQHWLYCGDQHALYGVEQPSIYEIERQPLVGRGFWHKAEHAHHESSSEVGSAENMEARLLLILSGCFIGYLPEHLAGLWQHRSHLRALAPESFSYQAKFALCIRRDRQRDRHVMAFRDFLSAQFKGNTTTGRG